MSWCKHHHLLYRIYADANQISEKDGQYKDCYCIPESATDPKYRPHPKSEDIAAAFISLPDLTEDNYASGPLDGVPRCQKASWVAPQRDSDGEPSVTDPITRWCSDMDGKTVSKKAGGIDTVRNAPNFILFVLVISKQLVPRSR